MGRKLFCEIHPICFEISVQKEVLLRNFKELFDDSKIAKQRSKDLLDNVVKGHSSLLVRKLHGIDIELQENKTVNIELACKKINGIIIKPGEIFSFWNTVGSTTKRKGYKKGLVVTKNLGFVPGYGGGICQMANMVHWLVLNSPLEVTELHHHSDALFPDEKRRVPFGTGTSVSYNNLDYRFKNTSDQDIQILVWVEDGYLCGELRSENQFGVRYKLVEENHHFKKIGEKFYRLSQVYRLVIDRQTNEQVGKELILDNHSQVMYDYDLIPQDQIRWT